MATVTGTDGGDFLSGTAASDIINALGGNDVITGTEGLDVIDGGMGIDRISFAPFASTAGRLLTITSSYVRDAAGRIDTTFTGVEAFTFNNITGASLTIDGSLTSGIALTLVGGSNPAAEASRLTGGAGDDVISVLGERAVIDAGGGADRVTIGVTGYVRAVQSADAIAVQQNGNASDTFASISNAEIVRFIGRNPFQSVYIDASALTTGVELAGGSSDDILVGGSGADRLEMVGLTFDRDSLTGNAGADTYFATSFRRAGADTYIDGIEAIDQISFAAVALNDANSPSFIGTGAFSGVSGQYRSAVVDGTTIVEIDVNGDAVADKRITLEGRAFTLVETAAGSNVLQIDSGAGQRVGTYGDDVIVGAAEAEFLFGHAGDDQLNGGGGADLIEGDAGNDSLRGGSGADVFLFDFENDDTGRDRVLDFDRTDVLVTPEALRDANGDGIIDFGRNRILNPSDDGSTTGDQISITTSEGGRLNALEYDGYAEIAGMTYYVYSRVGSAAGVETLTTNAFFDQLG